MYSSPSGRGCMICLIVTVQRLLWLRRMNQENRQPLSIEDRPLCDADQPAR
jgi:hypothetical protein